MNSATAELTERQIELIEKVKEAAKETGRTPTLKMLDENPDWPNTGSVRWHFRNYTELLTLAGLPLLKCTKRYGTKELKEMLRGCILELGRVPTQMEVTCNPRLPAGETFLNVFGTWEKAVAAAGFTMSWCSCEMRKKLLLDLQRKYQELGYKPPSPQDIQCDLTMEKVCVYVQIFGDLEYAKQVAGVQKDYHARQRKEIVETLVRLREELGRVPKIRDEGVPSDKLMKKVFGSYENALLAAGMRPHHRYYSRECLIRQLQEKATELGRSPTVKEITDDPDMASIQTLRKAFGSHAKALKAAGLPPAPVGQGHTYTQEELIFQLKRKFAELGRAPDTHEINMDPEMASAGVFARMFGSHKLALEAAGISAQRIHTKYTREELILQLQEKAAQLGRPPKQKEVDQDPEMASAHTLKNEFGGFTQALEAAGLNVVHKREYTDDELLGALERKYLAGGFLRTGKAPTNKEINADPEMASTRAYDAHFGTTNAARKLVEQKLLTGKA